MKDILFVDKPVGWTSFDVVAKIRGAIRATYTARGEKPTKRQLKVGHTGTLDPFATGLLVILLGDACSRSNEFLKLDKVYEATIELGKTSTTGDPEGDITQSLDLRSESLDLREVRRTTGSTIPSEHTTRTVLAQFTGEISQTPPAFSAIKIDGKRAYDLARQGKVVSIPPRIVTIYSLELLEYEYPLLTVRAHVSSGTYIRTLAEDIGKSLGTGAYCSTLRRMQVGEFNISKAQTIDEVLATV